MTSEQMIEMARSMRNKGIEPLPVYVMSMPGGEWWVVPVPHDDSGKWPVGTDENGDDVPLPPLQPFRIVRNV